MPEKGGIFKLLLTGIICFAGVVAGVWVGSVWILNRPASAYGINEYTGGEQASYLTFKVGDAFPHERFTTADHRQGSFDTLLFDKNTLLFLVDPGCGPCIDLLQFWRERIKQRLNPNVHMVAVIDRERGTLSAEYATLLSQFDVVAWIDGAQWEKAYHAAFWPTIIGVDVGGFVVHEQFGFEGTIDRKLVEYFIRPEQR